MGCSVRDLFTDPAERFLLCNREPNEVILDSVIGQNSKIMSSFLFKWEKRKKQNIRYLKQSALQNQKPLGLKWFLELFFNNLIANQLWKVGSGDSCLLFYFLWWDAIPLPQQMCLELFNPIGFFCFNWNDKFQLGGNDRATATENMKVKSTYLVSRQ